MGGGARDFPSTQGGVAAEDGARVSVLSHSQVAIGLL